MKRCILFLCSILPLLALAKPKIGSKYPQDYFRNPLNIPIFLAGNFGECRPGHFHSGIDIKTNGKENQPVYAAADGYISRIKMEKGGFGHGLYITHPNGYTTLYAHLNNFVPALQKYLRQQQYKKERWDVDLQFEPGQFPVKKGEQIAWSGNTGASTAPHLHFEIRNTETERPLNPELFGLPIIDTRPPVPAQIAVYRLSTSIYEQTPQLFKLAKKGDLYKTPVETVKVNDALVGIGVNVDDYMNGSDNTINFYTARVFMDDVLQEEIGLDDIGYDETRYLHAYVDYKVKKTTGQWIQCFFQLKGNHLDRIYEHVNKNDGVLNLSDKQEHKVRVELTDDRDNISTVSLSVQYTGGVVEEKQCQDFFTANKVNSFRRSNVMFSLGEDALYDDICFRYDEELHSAGYSARYMIHQPYVPVHKYFDLSIKPDKPIPFDLRDKIVLMYSDGKSDDGTAAVNTSQGWYRASVRNFGTYWLVADTIPPVIRSLQKDNTVLGGARISFVIKDALTSVKKYRAEIDGKWVCMEQHGDDFFYVTDEHCGKGKHIMVVTAADENGNSRTLTINFIR